MGSYNFGTVSFRGIGALNLAGFKQLAVGRIQAGTMGTSWDRIGFLGVGAAFTGLLFFLRYRFPGFPLHPIGFTISASAPLRNTTLTIFNCLGFEDDCVAAWRIGALSQVDTAFSGDDGCLYGGYSNRRCCGLDLVPRAGAYDPCRVVSGPTLLLSVGINLGLSPGGRPGYNSFRRRRARCERGWF